MPDAGIVLKKEVRRDGEVVFTAHVTIVAIGETGQAARLPANIRRQMH